jgi:transposase
VIEVGIDWAEDHHDVAVLDEAGRLLASRRIPEGVEGLARLHAVLAEQVEDPAQVLVGVETDRGLLVGALVAAGYQVYAVNPRAVDRYRDRHGQAGAKSDAGDARVLADLVRTDRHQHRRVAVDSELAEAIKILAPSHQNLIWTRQRLAMKLRSTLGEFYPATLAAFAELASPEALAVLAAAPTPARGQRLTVADLVGMCGRVGRRRELQRRAEAIHQALQAEQLAAPALLADAYGASVAAIVDVLTSLSAQIDSLHATLSKHLNSTRTRRSCVVCPDSASSSAPGCSASSGMTRIAMPMLRPARTTRGPPRSPGRPASA